MAIKRRTKHRRRKYNKSRRQKYNKSRKITGGEFTVETEEANEYRPAYYIVKGLGLVDGVDLVKDAIFTSKDLANEYANWLNEYTVEDRSDGTVTYRFKDGFGIVNSPIRRDYEDPKSKGMLGYKWGDN